MVPAGRLVAVAVIVCVGMLWTQPACAKSDFKEADRRLRDAIVAKNEESIAYWVDVMGISPSVKALTRVLAVGENYPNDPVRTAVQQALIKADTPECLAFYDKQLRKKNVRRALLVVGALGRMKTPDSVAPIVTALDVQRDPRVVTLAVKALRYKPSKDAVGALIQLYGRVSEQRDTLWAEVRVSLLALTGEAYTSVQDWQQWWEVSRANWQPKGAGSERGARTQVYRPEGSGQLDLPRLFGHEISSKRVVFVIDTSQSMREKMESKEEQGGTGTGSKTRLLRAQEELIKAVLALRKDVRFGIIAYNTQVSILDNERLWVATQRNKRKAIKFIQSWQADGTTSTGDATLAALAIPEIDTILLLSDGSPTNSHGKVVDTKPIIEAITADNLFKRVIIHTLGFAGANQRFMRALSDANGGTYAPIR